MNPDDKLKKIYNLACSLDSETTTIPKKYLNYLDVISTKVYSQKGVYTVLITLILHKILNPKQDIRYHQSSMKNGFSGRSYDTQYVTPTLKSLGLPSMAESGWLTRSLEQPHPYDLDYKGHIQDTEVREAFLNIIDFVQNKTSDPTELLKIFLHKIIDVKNKNKIEITPLTDPEALTIEKITEALSQHFFYDYGTYGGSKLPVIAFHSIYSILVDELKRFDGCSLEALGSHTACDRTSKKTGDIQVFKDTKLFEALEVKLGRVIDENVVLIACEKIMRYNPHRYYILSSENIKEDDRNVILKAVKYIKEKHGCQIIINGLIPSLKYYLRMVSSLEEFVLRYSEAINIDNELKKTHKEVWNKIIETTLK